MILSILCILMFGVNVAIGGYTISKGDASGWAAIGLAACILVSPIFSLADRE